jgi:hypothetical protein
VISLINKFYSMVGDALITENFFFCKLEMLHSNFDTTSHKQTERLTCTYVDMYIYVLCM